MNEYTIETMYEGLTESFTVKITQEMTDSFRNTTGDLNPMHTNDDFAQHKVVRGTLKVGVMNDQ